MTAQHDEPGASRSRFPRGPATIGILCWVIYFCALIAVYTVAFNRHSRGCQLSAGWGIAISLAVALVACALAPGGRRSRAAAPGPVRGYYAAQPFLLAAASVAVVWVAVNFTLQSDPAGAWILALLASTGAAAGLLGETDLLSGRPEPATRSQAPPAGDPKPPQGRPEVKAPLLTLLSPEWPDRLAEKSLRVALDVGFWHEAYNGLATQANEQGGVALTARAKDAQLVIGAVFPAQLTTTKTFCEFPTAEIDRVRRAIDSVAVELGVRPGDITVTWVHTHPGLNVFLSGTDHRTAELWRTLDPGFTPIVIDASQKNLEEQIGVFDPEGGKIGPLDIVDDVVGALAARQLRESLIRTYQEDGERTPMVFLAGQ